MDKKFTREEIFNKLSDILVDDFEIDKELITPEANLFEDLDLDSIDAVDLAVKLQYFTDKKISPENFKQIRNINDVVNAIEELIKFITENADPVTLCISIEGKYNSNSYNLQLSFEYDLTNIWADGQTLIKHSEIRAHHMKEFNSNRILTSIVLLKDEGIENLICPLNIEQIANFKNEYNTNLLARAIINCLNKNKNYENPKQKKLQKKR